MLVCSLPTPLAKISPIDNHQVKYEDMQHLMFGNATKLVNAAPHRWISTCKVLEEVLRSWEALEKHYLDNEAGGNFPLAVHKTAIEELYSLMKPVALLIKNSQRSGGPTGLSTFIDLCTLQATPLDMEKPLLITVPRKVRLGEAGSATAVTKRAASSFQAVTTSTRKMRRDAILKRFFNKRYDEAVFAVPEPSYVFEMAACMSPFLHDLKWLPKFCSSPEEVDRVDKHIRTKVVDLMVSMAEGAGMQAEERPDSDETTSSNKRKRPAGLFATPSVSKKQDDEQAQRMADSGLFGDDSEGDGNGDKTGPCKLTLREVCQQEFGRFQERFKSTKAKDYPLLVLLSFWAGEGRALYPNMARVARVLLSVPASAAVLERDFSTAGRLITESRSRLAGEYVEMTLFVNGNKEYIPVEVPSLSESQMKEACLVGSPTPGQRWRPSLPAWRTSFPSWSSTPTSTTSTRQRLPPSRSRGVREEQWGDALGIGVVDVFVILSKTIDLVRIFIYFSALPFFVELSFQPSNSNLNFTPAVFD